MADYMLVDPSPNGFWPEVSLLFKNGMSCKVAVEVNGCPNGGVVWTRGKFTSFSGPFCLLCGHAVNLPRSLGLSFCLCCVS